MRGSFSGPITISATTPITSSSEKPMSNMCRCQRTKRRRAGALVWRKEGRSDLLLGLALDLAFDRLVDDRGRVRVDALVAAALAHPVLEAAHRAAQVGAHVAQLLGAEDEHHDHQNDQPMPDAERAH